jgi:hypothetical protein
VHDVVLFAVVNVNPVTSVPSFCSATVTVPELQVAALPFPANGFETPTTVNCDAATAASANSDTTAITITMDLLMLAPYRLNETPSRREPLRATRQTQTPPRQRRAPRFRPHHSAWL